MKTLGSCIPRFKNEKLIVVAVPESVRMVSMHTLTSAV